MAVATEQGVPGTESVGQYMKILLEHYNENAASEKWWTDLGQPHLQTMQLALQPVLRYSEALERRAGWVSEKNETANYITCTIYKSLPSCSQSKQWNSKLVIFLFCLPVLEALGLCSQCIPCVSQFI